MNEEEKIKDLERRIEVLENWLRKFILQNGGNVID